jgi:hypothetical protein
MLIGDNELVGALDFDDTSIGTPDQELRLLRRINEATLLATVSTYEALSGKQLSVEASTVWAITQELAAYSKQLTSGNATHPKFARACRKLNAWLPAGAWGEGQFHCSPTRSRQ